MSSRNAKEIASFENRQRRRDQEEDLKWKERRGRTLSVAFESFDSESGRRPRLLRRQAKLDLEGAQAEPPGFTQPSDVSSNIETLPGFAQAFEANAGDKDRFPKCPETPGYTETLVKPFTVTDVVDAEAGVNDCAKEKGKDAVKPKALSRSAVRWVYLQIWIHYYGFRSISILGPCKALILIDCFRLALVILFGVTLTATIVGFWLGFDRTAVRQLNHPTIVHCSLIIVHLLIAHHCSLFIVLNTNQVYLPLNLSLGLAFLVLVIRAVHYFTQPDQREKVAIFFLVCQLL